MVDLESEQSASFVNKATRDRSSQWHDSRDAFIASWALESFAKYMATRSHSRCCARMIAAAPCNCGVTSTTAPSHSRSQSDKHINDCHFRWREQPQFWLIRRNALSSELCKYRGMTQLPQNRKAEAIGPQCFLFACVRCCDQQVDISLV